MIRFFRWVGYLILLFIVVCFGFVLFSQTDLFRNWVKQKMVTLVNENLNANLNIRSLQGTLFTNIDLTGLSLQQNNEPFLEIGRVTVRIRPLSLLSKTLKVQQMRIEEPKLRFVRRDSSSWNFQSLAKESSSPGNNAQSRGPLSGWKIEIPDLRVVSGHVTIRGLKNNPSDADWTIAEINLTSGLRFDTEHLHISLVSLSLTSTNPDLIVQSFRSEIGYDAKQIGVENLSLETPNSKVRSNVHVSNLTENPNLDLTVQTRPLSFEELRRTFPKLTLYGDPNLEIKIRGPLDDLEFDCKARLGKTDISFFANLRRTGEILSYQMKGSARRLDIAEIIGDPQLETDLNLDFNLDGQGVDVGKIKARVTVNVDSSTVLGRQFRASTISCQASDDSLFFDASAVAEETFVQTNGFLTTESDRITYSLDGRVQELNLARLTGRREIASSLNLDLHLVGSGIELRDVEADVILKLDPSFINEVPLDSARIDFNLANRVLILSHFRASSPFGKLEAAGKLSNAEETDIRFAAEMNDLSKVSTLVKMDSLLGSGRLNGHLKGPIDSLYFDGEIALEQLNVAGISASQLRTRVGARYHEDEYSISLDGDITNASAAGFDSLNSNFQVTYTDTVINFRISGEHEHKLRLLVVGDLKTPPDSLKISLQDFQVGYSNSFWKTQSTNTEFIVSGSRIQTPGFHLASGDQLLTLRGAFDPHGTSAVHLELREIRIAAYDSLLSLNGNVDGRVDFGLGFFGNLDRPKVEGQVNLTEGRVLNVPFEAFSGTFSVDTTLATWDFALSKTENDSLLETSGRVPISLFSDTSAEWLLDDRPLQVKLNARGLELSLLQPFIRSLKNIKGVLIADIVLTNTLQDLRGSGPIRLVDAQFDIPELGTRYRNINAAILLNDKDLIIRDLRVRSDGGKLDLIEGGLSLSEQSVQGFKARFRTNDFPLMKNKKMRAKVKGDLELSGSVQSPYFSGDLTVSESRIYYPAWFEDEAVVEFTAKPFFVIGSDSVTVDSSGALRFQKSRKRPESTFTESEFYKKLRGELALVFPRNSWIRSSDTNIEISGNLVAVKEEGQDITLFGSLSTLRGYYELLGNRFQISRGNLVFYGQPDPDPGIDIEAQYEFRDGTGRDSEKHLFTVLISGSLSTPEFRFSLDGSPAEQQDVLAILVFGQSFDNLGISQRNSVSDNPGIGGQATGLITGQLLKRLSGELGNELRLDVIQIESGKNLEDARLRIGKYVTPDVFVSISQDFGAEGNRKVELEYEIPIDLQFLNLLLQASQEKRGATGVDVIWKIEW